MNSNNLLNTVTLVKNYLKSNDAIYEKKAYKLLIKLVPKMHSSYMKDVIL